MRSLLAVRQPYSTPLSRLWRFEVATRNLKRARLLRQEPVELESGPVQCFVIEAEHAPFPGTPPEYQSKPARYWIDAQRYLILKIEETTLLKPPDREPSEVVRTLAVRKLSIGEALPDSLFQFTPPEGAVLVEKLTSGRRSKYIGKTAPPFTVKDVRGNTYSSASLKGKVVLLDFSTDWSSGDTLLAFAEVLHRAFGRQDLTALAVVRDRLGNAATHYTAEGYSIPIVLDPLGATASAMGIGQSGVVVIGRDGNVLLHVNGGIYQTPADVLKALKEAGIW